MGKYALFAFNGEPICFLHVLLNGLDLAEKGADVKIVVEGASTAVIPAMLKEGSPLQAPFAKAREKGLIDAVCLACATKMGTVDQAREAGLPLSGSMSGHPPMSDYLGQGYTIITF